MARRLQQRYEQAVAEGRGEQFLANHPNFAANRGGGSGGGGGGGNNLGRRVNNLQSAEEDAALAAAQQQAQLSNITQNQLFGTQTMQYDEAGNPIGYTQSLSPEQQQIYDAGVGLTQQGQSIAGGMMDNYQAFGMSPEELGEMRGNIEDQVFGRLTEGVDQAEGEELADFEQQMYNKGIPYSDDPESLYQKRLGDHNKKFKDIRLSARQTAVATGGQEMQAQFGMGMQGHQQNMNDMTAMQGQGTGFMMPQFQGYAAPGYQVTSPVDIWATNQAAKLAKKKTGAEVNLMGSQAGYYNHQAGAPYPGAGGGEGGDSSIIYG